MDYQEFPGEVISEQDKAFAQEFANRQGTDQGAPLSPAADVQGVHRLYAPIGIQLPEREL